MCDATYSPLLHISSHSLHGSWIWPTAPDEKERSHWTKLKNVVKVSYERLGVGSLTLWPYGWWDIAAVCLRDAGAPESSGWRPFPSPVRSSAGETDNQLFRDSCCCDLDCKTLTSQMIVSKSKQEVTLRRLFYLQECSVHILTVFACTFFACSYICMHVQIEILNGLAWSI